MDLFACYSNSRKVSEQNPENDEEYLQGSQQCLCGHTTSPRILWMLLCSIQRPLSKSPQNSCLSKDPVHTLQQSSVST